MKTQNNVRLIGYLGQDPIVKQTSTGSTRATLRMATDKFRKDSNGKVQRTVTWHDIVAWEKTAEALANEYIKGSHVLVEGELIHRTYEDRNGHTRYVTEVKAFLIMNLDR